MSDISNRLLDSLSPATKEMVLSRCTPVPLVRRTVLYQPQVTPEFCYFLTSGMVSVITTMQDGESAEVSVLGREGLSGGLQLLGPGRVPTTCIMQLDGSGLRIPTVDMRRLFDTSEEVRSRVLEHVQEQSNLMGQIAACNRLHEAEERLARWLLMTSDRIGNLEMNFTQEFLAELLGARRTTVTMVAGALQRSGLIEYRRGRVKILNPDELKEAACECYRVTADLHTQLYKS
jgi:CRP-like cAMP-binding protein